jgi:hypothetical protein
VACTLLRLQASEVELLRQQNDSLKQQVCERRCLGGLSSHLQPTLWSHVALTLRVFGIQVHDMETFLNDYGLVWVGASSEDVSAPGTGPTESESKEAPLPSSGFRVSDGTAQPSLWWAL